jgi:hypothetical protein
VQIVIWLKLPFYFSSSTFVFLSTIFVYPNPYNVDEDTLIDTNLLTPYGLHRYKLEQFIQKKFRQSVIVRLPNLFGQNLKKNFIYDLIHHNRWDLTHKDSSMQWYNLENIWQDITIAINNQLPLVNFSVAPLAVKRIAKYSLGVTFPTITEKPPLNHRMLTKYDYLYKKKNGFLYNQYPTLQSLKDFILKNK